MKTNLIILFLLGFIPFLRAEKLLVANCEMGSGCVFYLADISIEDAAILDDDESILDLPENAIHVILKEGNKYHRYYETEKTRSQLDQFYGGDGYTMIHLFNPNFQPRSGIWRHQFGTVQGNTCYGQSTNMIKNALSGKMISGNVEFPEPFFPEFMMNSKDVKWYFTSPNSYRGVLGEKVLFMEYNVHIKNEMEIEGMFIITIDIPNVTKCVNQIPFKMKCIQPKPKKLPKEAWVDWVDIPIDLGLGKEKVKANVPRIEDEPKTHVPRIEDEPKTHVPRLDEE
jgi:hypothetical protein